MEQEVTYTGWQTTMGHNYRTKIFLCQLPLFRCKLIIFCPIAVQRKESKLINMSRKDANNNYINMSREDANNNYINMLRKDANNNYINMSRKYANNNYINMSRKYANSN